MSFKFFSLFILFTRCQTNDLELLVMVLSHNKNKTKILEVYVPSMYILVQKAFLF